MDIYEFFNSPAIAKHCKKSKKVGFNAIHAAIIVDKSRKHTDEEKRDAYQWIIKNMRNISMPDVSLHIPCFAFGSEKVRERYTEEERRTQTTVLKGGPIHDYLRIMLADHDDSGLKGRASPFCFETTVPHPFEPCDFIENIYTNQVYMVKNGGEEWAGFEVFNNGKPPRYDVTLPILDCVHYTEEKGYVYFPFLNIHERLNKGPVW